jgi:hypothetical protein
VPAVIAAAVGLLPFIPGGAGAQGGSDTAFTYQGFLRDDGIPANGQFRMVFELLKSGTPEPVAPPVIGPVEVTDGVFTAKLDFGPVFNGSPVDLHILIDLGGRLIPLDPPQRICPTPLAMRAASAESVDSVPDTALSDNVPIIVNNSLGLPGADASLRFGPLGECRIGIDPRFPGLVESDPVGFRLLGQDNQGCRLIFGPTMDCTVEIDPQGPPGLLLRDPSGIRIHPPEPGSPRLLFGPTDLCRISLEPDLPGLLLNDPNGIRILDPSAEGIPQLIFGPTDLCRISIDPNTPGLLLNDPNGIRILDPSANGIPQLFFGPTDECRISVDPERGLLLRDPRGITLPFATGPAGQLLPAVLTMGDAGECRWRVNAPDTGPKGMFLEDPEGLFLVNPQGGAGALSFGETGECRIRTGLLPNDRLSGLIFDDPNGMQFNTPESFFDVILANEFVQTSTRRLKDNIQPIEKAIEKIKQLEGVTFDWKPERGGKPSLGFIAEDVGKVFPQVVSYEKDGVNARGVNYGHLVAVTVEGIKQQQSQIETQQSEIESLRSENAALEQRLERLEKFMEQRSNKEADHDRRL